MSTIRESLLGTDFMDHVLTDSDLEYLFDGTAASRYALVNKALHKKDLIKIRRGLYIFADKYRKLKISKFFLASRIVSHSYISMESALSYHGWIPESVSTVTSMISQGRTRNFKTPFGDFQYHLIRTNDYEFLNGVARIEEIPGSPCFIASPLRALMDYVIIKKIKWQGLDFLTEGLRIELTQLLSIDQDDFSVVKTVYQNKRVFNFIEKLLKELIKNGYQYY